METWRRSEDTGRMQDEDSEEDEELSDDDEEYGDEEYEELVRRFSCVCERVRRAKRRYILAGD